MFPAEWTHPEGMNPNAYDPELAKQLLTDAGWTSCQITSSTTMPTR